MSVGETRHNLLIFTLALLSFFMTAAALDISHHLAWRNMSPFLVQLWLILQWFTVMSLILNATSKLWVMSFVRWWRGHPLLLWLMILLATPIVLIAFELLRFEAPLYSEYLAWNLLWIGFMLFVVGVKAGEYRGMAQRIGASRLSGLLVSLTTFVLILIGAEISLRTWLIFSNGYATGSIHTTWVYRYWNPLNELLFRDYPIYREVDDNQQKVMVLGDSFAAGIGVNHIDDTFPHLLGDKLGNDYEMYVVAHAGWNTDQQAEGLAMYPFEPDILIYSYFLNDASYIDPAVHGLFLEAFPPPPGILFDLVNRFHVADFLYWNIYTQYLRPGNTDYATMMLDIYRDEALWEAHKEDIRLIIDWTRNVAEADMIMLLWPLLNQVEASQEVHIKLKAFMEELGVRVVDMSDYVADVPILQRVANPFDMHPSMWSHQVASEALYEALVDEGIIGQ